LNGVFPALIFDAPTVSSGHCYEPNHQPVGAIVVVFGGDPYIDIICEQTMVVNNLSIQLEILNAGEYS